MRKVWSSVKELPTTRLSSRAEARSVPNGFSMMTRAQLPSQRLVQASGFQVLENRFELVRTGRQVKRRLPRVPWLLSISSRRLASCS